MIFNIDSVYEDKRQFEIHCGTVYYSDSKRFALLSRMNIILFLEYKRVMNNSRPTQNVYINVHGGSVRFKIVTQILQSDCATCRFSWIAFQTSAIDMIKYTEKVSKT